MAVAENTCPGSAQICAVKEIEVTPVRAGLIGTCRFQPIPDRYFSAAAIRIDPGRPWERLQKTVKTSPKLVTFNDNCAQNLPVALALSCRLARACQGLPVWRPPKISGPKATSYNQVQIEICVCILMVQKDDFLHCRDPFSAYRTS